MGVMKITGMSCGHCVASVQEALEKVEGVENVRVDLDGGQATYDGDVPKEVLENVVTGIGFEVVSIE